MQCVFYKTLHGGLLNQTVCCFENKHSDEQDGVVFRIWNESLSDYPQIDHDKEVAAMQVRLFYHISVPVQHMQVICGQTQECYED